MESVGPAWVCGSRGPWSSWGGEQEGRDRIGDRLVLWQRPLARPDVIGVAHPGAAALFAALLGVKTKPQAYLVRLLTSRPGSGGVRWWFECPACALRVGRLYLPPTRPRLGCRRCCELVYASQYPAPLRRRKRRGRR